MIDGPSNACHPAAAQSCGVTCRDFDIKKYSFDARADYRPDQNTSVVFNYGLSNAQNLIELTGLGAGQEHDEVQPARDGEEGFASIASFQPDLVVSDVMMPRMNGYDLVRKMRASVRSAPEKSVEVIVVLSRRAPTRETPLSLARDRSEP